MKIIIGPSSKELGEKVAQITSFDQINVINKIFPDGESYVRLENRSIEEEHVVIIHTTCRPQDTNLMQLALLANTAKQNKAKKITAVIPYLAYSRQDKIFLEGEGISISAIGKMLKASGVEDVLTVNIHSKEALDKFSLPTQTLSAIPLLAKYFIEKGVKNAISIAPDIGAMDIAKQAQEVLGGDIGYLEKSRDRYTGFTTHTGKNLNVLDKTAIIFDDIISTGGTIVGAAKILLEKGAKYVYAACSHGLLIDNAENKILNAGVKDIIATDTVPSSFSRVTVAPLIAKAIKALE